MAPLHPHKLDNSVSTHHLAEGLQSNDKFQVLQERLCAIEGGGYFGLRDASELCPVPDVVIPSKFKVP